MSFARKRISVVFALLLTCVLSTIAFADTIRLKDGSIIKGRIVSFAGGKFTIAIGEGTRSRQMTFGAAEIDSIVFDSPAATATSREIDYKLSNPRVVVSDQTRRSETQPELKKPEQRKPELKTAERRPVTQPQTVTPRTASATTAGPISWNVKVLADNTSNGWTNTGWVVKKGQVIRITSSADNTISLGNGKTSNASGLGDVEDSNKLLKHVPTGALIAVIGDDNNDFIYIGSSREIKAERDGALFLGINEGKLDDNSGALDIKIEILPGTGN
jgi:hypothetical protein